jgi:hypothetical protein
MKKILGIVLIILILVASSIISMNLILSNKDVIQNKYYVGKQNINLALAQEVSKKSYIDNSWYVTTSVYTRSIYLLLPITIEYNNLEVCTESELEKVKEKELKLGKEVFDNINKQLELKVKTNEKD